MLFIQEVGTKVVLLSLPRYKVSGLKQRTRLHHIGLGGYFWVAQQGQCLKGFLSFLHLFLLERPTSPNEELMEPEEDQEVLPQGSQEKIPTLIITATRVQDLEVLGPTAVSYISKEQGLHLGQGQEQGTGKGGGGVVYEANMRRMERCLKEAYAAHMTQFKAIASWTEKENELLRWHRKLQGTVKGWKQETW